MCLDINNAHHFSRHLSLFSSIPSFCLPQVNWLFFLNKETSYAQWLTLDDEKTQALSVLCDRRERDVERDVEREREKLTNTESRLQL